MSDSVTIIECSDEKALNKDNLRLQERSKRFLCEVCNIKSSSQCDYVQHLSGKKHLKKLADQCSDVESLSDDFLGNQLGEKSELGKILEKNRCEICDIECTNQFHRAVIVKL